MSNVVIVRKDKRIRHKFAHLFAFAVTGGASGIVTGAEVAANAQYNARTRALARVREPRRRRVEFTREEHEYLRAHVPAHPSENKD